MSKKININIPNKLRPNLSDLFRKYLVRKSKDYSRELESRWDDDEYGDILAYWDRVFPGWDKDSTYHDDEGCVIYPIDDGKSSRRERFKNKKKHKHRSNRCHELTIPFSGEEEDYNFDDVNMVDYSSYDDMDSDIKEIWFYPDYHDKEDRMSFSSLHAFDEYCDSMGYFVPKEIGNDISWRYESHCCLNPHLEKAGLLEILSGHSYGDMFYAACDDEELGG